MPETGTKSQRRPGGRPTGKASNPEFKKTTVYLRKATKTAAQHLILDSEDKDLSELVEELLQQWLKTGKQSAQQKK